MFGFFGRDKSKSEHLLAVDIGSASISAAYFKRHATKDKAGTKFDYEVLKVFRYAFSMRDSQKIFLGKIKKLFSDVSAAKFYPDKILFAFADPYYLAETTKKEITRQHPKAPIRWSEIGKLVSVMEKEIWERQSEPLSVVNAEVVSQSVNGYELLDAEGYSGKTLAVEAKFLFITQYLKDNLEEAKQVFFPKSAVEYYSDAYILWRALSESKMLTDPVLLLDVGGEITSVSMADKNKNNYLGLVSFGIRTLGRRVVSYLKLKDLAEAESMLRRYTANMLEAGAHKKLEQVLAASLEDWSGELGKILSKTGSSMLPRKIILTGSGADFAIFNDHIRKNFKTVYNIEVIVKTLTPEDFKDLFISLGALYGGADAILVALILFHNQNA